MRKITEADNKNLSMLAYLDATNKKGNKFATIEDMCDYYLNKPEGKVALDNLYPTNDSNSVNAWQNADYKKLLANMMSKYKDWKITDVRDDNTTKNHGDGSGFYAYTVQPPDGKTTIVVIRGSEAMDAAHANDWKNDIDLSWKSDTPQQIDALKYLNDIAKKYPANSIIIDGHSLGANLALYAAIKAPGSVKARISHCNAFNGPGFNKNFIDDNAANISDIKSKITEFQNQDDVVSSLLYNPTTPVILAADNSHLDDALWKDTLSLKDLNLTKFNNLFWPYMYNHALPTIDADKSGNLIRATAQSKDFICTMVHQLTMATTYMPASDCSSLSDIIIGIMSKSIPETLQGIAGLTLTTALFPGNNIVSDMALANNENLVTAVYKQLIARAICSVNVAKVFLTQLMAQMANEEIKFMNGARIVGSAMWQLTISSIATSQKLLDVVIKEAKNGLNNLVSSIGTVNKNIGSFISSVSQNITAFGVSITSQLVSDIVKVAQANHKGSFTKYSLNIPASDDVKCVFRCDVDVMQKTITEYTDAIETMKKVKTDLDNKLGKLKDTDWKSEAGRTYYQQFKGKWFVELGKRIATLEALKNVLIQAKAKFETLEAQAERISYNG